MKTISVLSLVLNMYKNNLLNKNKTRPQTVKRKNKLKNVLINFYQRRINIKYAIFFDSCFSTYYTRICHNINIPLVL